MKSITKIRLNAEEIEKIVKLNFPQDGVAKITELDGGMFNSAYLVEGTGKLEKGAVLKLGSKSDAPILTYEKDILRAEVKAYKHLEDINIPIPEVYNYDYTKTDVPCDYFIMSYVPGKSYKSLDKKEKKECRNVILEELGASFAKIHTVSGPYFGYIKDYSRFRFKDWFSAFYSMMKDILSDAENKKCVLPYAEIRAVIKKNKAILNEVKVPKLVNFDLWAGNLFVDKGDDGYHISGIIDFERCFYGDPLADLASAVLIFDDPDKEPQLKKGYESISGEKLVFSKFEKIRLDLYRLYLAVIMYVETYRYGWFYARSVKFYCRRRIKKLLKKLLAEKYDK